MPKLGDAMTQGKVLTWRKRPGDTVTKGEPIAEIETDKVNVDIEAEEGGTLTEILVGEGQTAPIGAPIARIGAPGQQPASVASPRPSPPVPPPPAAAPSPEARGPQPPQATPGPRRAPAAAQISASPLARRLATEHGINLEGVRGSGPDGRIIKEDVEALLASSPSATAAAPPRVEADTDVPLSRMRQTIARRMSESKQHAPHFYVTVEVLMDEALRARQQLNEAATSRKVSVNDILIKAAALALRKFPNLNSAFLDGVIRRYGRINIAIAITLPEGLIAPVLRDCDQKSLLIVSAEAGALAERARSGHLRPDDYEGGTFTISNLGMFPAIDSFVAIINPPHAAILAAGSAHPQAVVHQNQVTVASVMKLTLSADHRVTDGAEVAQFLTELKRLLESPLTLVLPT